MVRKLNKNENISKLRLLLKNIKVSFISFIILNLGFIGVVQASQLNFSDIVIENKLKTKYPYIIELINKNVLNAARYDVLKKLKSIENDFEILLLKDYLALKTVDSFKINLYNYLKRYSELSTVEKLILEDIISITKCTEELDYDDYLIIRYNKYLNNSYIDISKDTIKDILFYASIINLSRNVKNSKTISTALLKETCEFFKNYPGKQELYYESLKNYYLSSDLKEDSLVDSLDKLLTKKKKFLIEESINSTKLLVTEYEIDKKISSLNSDSLSLAIIQDDIIHESNKQQNQRTLIILFSILISLILIVIIILSIIKNKQITIKRKISKQNRIIFKTTKRIKKINNEIKVLNKEILHRVKNNINISLNLLDKKSINTNPEIYGINLIYRHLYNFEDFDSIDIDHLSNLVIKDFLEDYHYKFISSFQNKFHVNYKIAIDFSLLLVNILFKINSFHETIKKLSIESQIDNKEYIILIKLLIDDIEVMKKLQDADNDIKIMDNKIIIRLQNHVRDSNS
jgi:hypothetical protein